MKKIGANLLFTMTGEPLNQGYVVIDENNCIQEVVDTNGNLNEIHGLAFYSGILIPGLIVGLCPEIISDEEIKRSKSSRILHQSGIQAADLSLHYPSVQEILSNNRNSFDENLMCNTVGAAQKNDLHQQIGSFEKGKCPGIIHIQGYDFTNRCLRSNAIIQRLA